MAKRRLEVFSAGCAACKDTLDLINQITGPSCEITILDMHDAGIAKRANALGIGSVPAVVVDGKLADGAGRRVEEASLRPAGIG